VVILSDTSAGLHVKGEEAAYVQYVRHLDNTSPALVQAKTAGTVENFARGYQDYLQAPLQVGRTHGHMNSVLIPFIAPYG
jgi:protein arginine N-methyltransferase 5